MGQIQEWLERYLDVESFFGGPPSFDPPAELDRRVVSPDQVEQVALSLRQAWDLGLAPIESLVEVLEDRGVKVGLVDGGVSLRRSFPGAEISGSFRAPPPGSFNNSASKAGTVRSRATRSRQRSQGA